MLLNQEPWCAHVERRIVMIISRQFQLLSQIIHSKVTCGVKSFLLMINH